MKRYWKLISIVSVIVLTISTFYIQSIVASSKYPEFSFKHISGSEEELKDLTIRAESGESGLYERVDITNNETFYHSEASFLEYLAGSNRSAVIKRYQKDYRNFMRGKQETINSYYEDSSTLAYAEIDWKYHDYEPTKFVFDIDVLNKDSEETTSIQLNVPKSEDYNYLGVEDVQVINGKLKVVTLIHPNGSQDRLDATEIHVFSFDIASKKLEDTETFHSIPRDDDGNGQTELAPLYSTADVNSEKYFLLKKVVLEEEIVDEEEGAADSSVMETEESPNGMRTTKVTLYAYNFETGETEELSLPTELQELIDSARISVYDGSIYLLNTTEEGLEVISYHIENEEISSKQTFDLVTIEELEPFIKVANDKMYIVAANFDENNKKRNTIIISDLESEELLYEGILERTDPDSVQSNYKLYINEIDITK
ncbi:hypothetical protein ACFSTA_10215 [Ornithinibacillus salinisoli]|uniref:Transcriptional regulator n=1 Tax=Ornithinibacillus salinisoli TaxID=1848459 RepID=A0ABW4VYS0_9BACI